VQISRIDGQTLRISHLDPLLGELLQRVVTSADPTGSEAAQERLFSKPTDDPEESGFVEDWREYVQPELRHIFESALEVINGDLVTMRAEEGGGGRTLTIPINHVESWIHGLNQARLALSARHAFSEEDMERILPLAGDPHSLALLQVRFYGILQELFLQELDGD
jgi:Domain of unknown function (DUF2017)